MMLYGEDDLVTRWIAERVPLMRGQDVLPCATMAWCIGDRVAAAVAFHDYMKFENGWQTIRVSMAADGRRWNRPGLFKEWMRYPFKQLNVDKLGAVTTTDNPAAVRLLFGIGFRREAILRKEFGPKVHAVAMSMLRSEWATRYGDA